MTWLRTELAPSPHAMDPAETEEGAVRFWLQHYSLKEIEQAIRDHKRALEHEEAILRGMERAREMAGKRQYADRG